MRNSGCPRIDQAVPGPETSSLPLSRAVTELVRRHCRRSAKQSQSGRTNRAGQQSLSVMKAKTPNPAASRRFPRYPLDIRVSAKVFRDSKQISLWGRSIEFGQDGIGITLTGELAPGEVATLELILPASSVPLKLRGLVRYRDGLRHGFEFLARDEVQREVIRRTCELLSAGT
jgi:hypothetical protein